MTTAEQLLLIQRQRALLFIEESAILDSLRYLGYATVNGKEASVITFPDGSQVYSTGEGYEQWRSTWAPFRPAP